MKIDIINQKNEKAGTIDLPERIFGAKWNADLVHQALMVQLANRREKLAHTKGRGEVSGGGKKPWRQKGPGRARHGSIRSPIWSGGGVSHGPTKEENFKRKINKKMKNLAVFSVLSKKLSDNEIKIIDKFNDNFSKTKDWVNFLKIIHDFKSKALLIPKSSKKSIHQAVSNIKNVDAISPRSLNVHDLLKNKNLVFEKDSIEEINNHYKK